jgi:A/G-specific adenine glycosylase
MLSTDKFRSIIYDFYAQNKRDFLWRDIDDPYRVVVSEIMLQQTQTFRVADKFEHFVSVLPTFDALAQAPFAVVLALWKGLGYNRRALYLQRTAAKVVNEYAGVLPRDPAVLETFDGIGPATARSIVTFAFNQPEVFIETNIRAVFIHHFFKKEQQVHDKEIFPLVAQMLDRDNPRQWYYALMDYGVYLKKQEKNPSRKSVHHAVQSKFEGSNRQVRGQILELLLRYGQLEIGDLYGLLKIDPFRVDCALQQMAAEQILKLENNSCRL